MKDQITSMVYSAIKFASTHIYKKLWLGLLFILCYKLVIIVFLKNYIRTDFIVWTALLLAPYIAQPITSKPGTYKYLYISLFFSALTGLTGVQTFYFLAIGMCILFAIESFVGSIGNLPFFLLGLISPTFKYFNNMLGFPIRLKLSEWVAETLKHLGYKIEISGNVFILNGSEFSVDPACVGLKMLAVSLLIGLFIMAYFQKQCGKQFSLSIATIILCLILIFNVLSNLLRILILAIFCILPHNPAHDLVGIICLILYVLIPSYLLIKYLVKKDWMGKTEVKTINFKLHKLLIIHTLLLVLFIILGATKLSRPLPSNKNLTSITFTGYTKNIVNDDIIKLEKPGILIYIKPLSRFYGAEHNPMICWVGSGYEFNRINKKRVKNKEIFTGTLKKGSEIIYSAWWFDSGKNQTSSQMEWRWQAFKGDDFYLVNVNSGDEEKLNTELNLILDK